MIKSSFNQIKKRIFGTKYRREYEDMIRLGSVFQKQKEELNILFRHSNFLYSLLSKDEAKTIKEKYNIEYHTDISSTLFKCVFDGIKVRSFSRNSKYNIDSIKTTNTYSRELFAAQEKEIELLFNRNFEMIKWGIKNNKNMYYVSSYNFIQKYHESRSVYYFDIYMSNRLFKEKYPENRLFNIPDDQIKEYKRLITQIDKIS